MPQAPTRLHERDRYLSTREAAGYVNYSINHFRALVRAGKIPPPTRIASKLLWRQSLLDAHLRALEMAQGVATFDTS
jgi:predicted DNA-binding transcriptional regulator AlpA